MAGDETATTPQFFCKTYEFEEFRGPFTECDLLDGYRKCCFDSMTLFRKGSEGKIMNLSELTAVNGPFSPFRSLSKEDPFCCDDFNGNKAIQGCSHDLEWNMLTQKLERMEDRIHKLEVENVQLKRRLDIVEIEERAQVTRSQLDSHRMMRLNTLERDLSATRQYLWFGNKRDMDRELGMKPPDEPTKPASVEKLTEEVRRLNDEVLITRKELSIQPESLERIVADVTLLRKDTTEEFARQHVKMLKMLHGVTDKSGKIGMSMAEVKEAPKPLLSLHDMVGRLLVNVALSNNVSSGKMSKKSGPGSKVSTNLQLPPVVQCKTEQQQRLSAFFYGRQSSPSGTGRKANKKEISQFYEIMCELIRLDYGFDTISKIAGWDTKTGNMGKCNACDCKMDSPSAFFIHCVSVIHTLKICGPWKEDLDYFKEHFQAYIKHTK